jgi:hypothetical protein
MKALLTATTAGFGLGLLLGVGLARSDPPPGPAAGIGRVGAECHRDGRRTPLTVRRVTIDDELAAADPIRDGERAGDSATRVTLSVNGREVVIWISETR